MYEELIYNELYHYSENVLSKSIWVPERVQQEALPLISNRTI